MKKGLYQNNKETALVIFVDQDEGNKEQRMGMRDFWGKELTRLRNFKPPHSAIKCHSSFDLSQSFPCELLPFP